MLLLASYKNIDSHVKFTSMYRLTVLNCKSIPVSACLLESMSSSKQ